MCGIFCSIGDSNAIINRALVKDLLSHRGPDGNGEYINKSIYLYHSRLAFSDALNGTQPMWSRDNKLAIVFEGELYNHLEIRNELFPDIVFTTMSDTETLLKIVESGRYDYLNNITGMFSFIALDFKNNSVILCCDPFGLKSIYYYHDRNKLIACSDLNTIISSCSLNTRIDNKSLQEIFNYGHLLGEKTIFNNIKSIPSGVIMKFDISIMAFHRVLALDGPENAAEKHIINSCDSIVVENALEKAIALQVNNERNIGITLSGGWDSSIVAGIAKKYNKDIKAYHIFMGGDAPDERLYANEISEFLKIELNNVQITTEDIFSNIENAIKAIGGPILNPQFVTLHILAMQINRSIKILLNGNGADELFGGYERYGIIRNKYAYRRIDSDNNLIYSLSKPPLFSSQGWKDLLNTNEIISDYGDYIYQNCFGEYAVDAKRELDYVSDLRNQIKSVDCLFINNSIESRSPFMDKEVLQAAFSASLNFNNAFGKKPILKDIASKYMSKGNLNRSKVGFRPPINEWVVGMSEYFELFYDKKAKREFYNLRGIQHAIDKFHKGSSNYHPYLFWLLINIELTCRIYNI